MEGATYVVREVEKSVQTKAVNIISLIMLHNI